MKFYRFAFLLLCISLSNFSQAKDFQLFNFGGSDGDKPKSELSPQEIEKVLQKKLPGIPVSLVEMSPKEGVYQVFYGSQVLYISADGQFIFTGNLVGLSEDEPVNLTERAKIARASLNNPVREKAIAGIKQNEMVIFKAKNEKYTINVFTDVDCGVCRKLHKEVPELNKLGITVRYLAYPRAGIGSSSYDKLVSIWCADDQQLAMDNAKLKRQFSSKSCENPVATQYQMTQKLGLTGTPALILSDGELIAGYAQYDVLYKHLENKYKNQESAGK